MARFRPHDPVGIAIFAPQIPGNGPGHPGIVIDGQHHRFCGMRYRHSRGLVISVKYALVTAPGGRPRQPGPDSSARDNRSGPEECLVAGLAVIVARNPASRDQLLVPR